MTEDLIPPEILAFRIAAVSMYVLALLAGLSIAIASLSLSVLLPTKTVGVILAIPTAIILTKFGEWAFNYSRVFGESYWKEARKSDLKPLEESNVVILQFLGISLVGGLLYVALPLYSLENEIIMDRQLLSALMSEMSGIDKLNHLLIDLMVIDAAVLTVSSAAVSYFIYKRKTGRFCPECSEELEDCFNLCPICGHEVAEE